jgi:outer membrane receptor protein involved in Fe transport
MQRSKRRKLALRQTFLVRAPLASAVMLALAPAQAQQVTALEEIIVTAQKRTENLQQVPLSIQALGTEKLEELNIVRFDDYVKYLPSVSYQTFGPGFALVYMRGVASGGDGNHSGSQPSVGIYLDEQPITTIQGALDVHLYDIARVEALAGPQGTLYGASSQAGTIRIITNKPDPSGFSASYGFEGNTVASGDVGYLAEGYVNAPLGEKAAIRLVGWVRHDGGYIDNVAGTRTWPNCEKAVNDAGGDGQAACTLDSTRLAKKDFNQVDTYGARAALRIDLNDSWTVTPSVMGQRQDSDGVYGYDPSVGDLKVKKFYPDTTTDKWVQAALTVEGQFSNLDVVYAGAYLKRDDNVDNDYSDYSYFYDTCCSYSLYITTEGGNPSIGQYIQGKDRYEKMSHELRVSTPQDRRLRFVGGLFTQRQEHGIEQRYLVENLDDALEVTGWPDTIWLTEQFRIDKDSAIFGELSYDITDKLTATGGLRFFKTDNSMTGFFGYGDWGWSANGEAACFQPIVPFRGAPCTTLANTVKENDHIGKVNLSYKFDEDRMVYVTWSEGFRPGGTNRRAGLPPYLADFLTNYEAGWKTTWADGRLRFNGALFLEEWKDFQYGLLGANGLTEIFNAAQARIRGVEADVTWAATDRFMVSGGIALIDSELTEHYCGFFDQNGRPETRNPCPDWDNANEGGADEDPDTTELTPQAFKGTELPVTPKFKANLTLRQEFNLGGFDAYWRGSLVHKGKSRADLRDYENGILGDQPSYEIVDFSAGISRGTYSVELFANNVFDERTVLYRYVQCAEDICGEQPYIATTPPRTIGLKFSQKF